MEWCRGAEVEEIAGGTKETSANSNVSLKLSQQEIVDQGMNVLVKKYIVKLFLLELRNIAISQDRHFAKKTL